MIYRALEVIQIFLAGTLASGRANEGVPRGPRGPKDLTPRSARRGPHILPRGCGPKLLLTRGPKQPFRCLEKAEFQVFFFKYCAFLPIAFFRALE